MERLAQMCGSAMGEVQDRSRVVWDLARANPWITAGVLTGSACIWRYVTTPKNLPPGPTNFPLVGAVSCLGLQLEQRMFKWKDRYGEIVSFYKAGRLHIVLNSDRTIKEAFVKQGEDYAHRSTFGVFSPEGFGDAADDIFVAPYNEQWKKNKKFAITTLKNFGFGTPKSEEKMNLQLQFLEEILLKTNGAPISITDNCRILSAGVISSIVFSGGSTWNDPNNEPLRNWIDKWFNSFTHVFLIWFAFFEMIPPIPIISWAMLKLAFRRMSGVHLQFAKYIESLLKPHQLGIEDREAENVTDAYLKDRGADDETVALVARTILLFLPDAIDTAASIDNWAMVFIAANPEVQQMLQKEIEEICGQSRTPTSADRSVMPYAQAFIHEVLRINLVTPMSIPREPQKDLTLLGYNIPKGSQVSGNFYGVHFDPEVFPNPMKFDPMRFIDADGKFNSTLGGRLLTFGIGPRKCIAELYFKVHMFSFITHILQRFNVQFDPTQPPPKIPQHLDFFSSRTFECKFSFTER